MTERECDSQLSAGAPTLQLEVSTLCQIYGDRLFILGLYSTRSERRKHLVEVLKIDPTLADSLIDRDEDDEYTKWGQRTRDAFELGDVFFRIDEPSDAIFWEEAANADEQPADRVVFKHYVGVGARRYMDLFSLTLSSGRRVKRKNKTGESLRGIQRLRNLAYRPRRRASILN